MKSDGAERHGVRLVNLPQILTIERCGGNVVSMGTDILPSEVDFVNEHVAKITKISLGFLYQGDNGREPTRRSLKMDLDAFTRLQQENDKPPTTTVTTVCGSCRHEAEKPVPRQYHSISQKMSMSEAWSRELRRKIKESEQKREVQVRVDPYFEDWE